MTEGTIDNAPTVASTWLKNISANVIKKTSIIQNIRIRYFLNIAETKASQNTHQSIKSRCAVDVSIIPRYGSLCVMQHRKRQCSSVSSAIPPTVHYRIAPVQPKRLWR